MPHIEIYGTDDHAVSYVPRGSVRRHVYLMIRATDVPDGKRHKGVRQISANSWRPTNRCRATLPPVDSKVSASEVPVWTISERVSSGTIEQHRASAELELRIIKSYARKDSIRQSVISRRGVHHADKAVRSITVHEQLGERIRTRTIGSLMNERHDL